MFKNEIAEIKKQFTHANCSITKVCGCYVDGDKEMKAQFSQSFLCLPEEETFKYFEIFKKTLSGSIGKNLINMEFPINTEFNGGTQEFLLKIKNSELKDEKLVEEFYKKIIELYDFTGNYLILLLYAAYDVPGKTNDKLMMEDASDEVYSFILCSICPVNLTKPGLSYNSDTNLFQARIQDWVVEAPNNGFLFPAFNDRSTDLHSMLYYTKDSEEMHTDFVDKLFACDVPMSAGGQKQTFQTLVEETLGDNCDYETVRSIHDKLNEIIEEHKNIQEPLTLDMTEVKNLLKDSGVEEEKLIDFDVKYEEMTGKNGSLLASNVASTKVFEVKTPDVIIKVNSGCTNLVETKVIDGRRCLVIEINDQVEVNGIMLRNNSSIENDMSEE